MSISVHRGGSTVANLLVRFDMTTAEQGRRRGALGSKDILAEMETWGWPSPFAFGWASRKPGFLPGHDQH